MKHTVLGFKMLQCVCSFYQSVFFIQTGFGNGNYVGQKAFALYLKIMTLFGHIQIEACERIRVFALPYIGSKCNKKLLKLKLSYLQAAFYYFYDE